MDLAGLIGVVWQGHRRSLEAHKAEEVKAFVLGLFAGADPALARGDELTARELVEAGSSRIEREFADEPAVRAEVMTFLGDIHEKLGQPDKALASAEAALGLLEKVQGNDGAAIGNAMVVKGRALLAKGEIDRAAAAIEHAPAVASRVAATARRGGGSRSARHHRASTRQGRAIAHAYPAGAGHPPPRAGPGACGRGDFAQQSRRGGARNGGLPAAQSYHEAALALRRRILPPNHPDLGFSLNNLGALLFAQGLRRSRKILSRSA